MPENKCGMPLLLSSRAIMSRSYFRHSALQLNFMSYVPNRRDGPECLFSRPGMSIGGWDEKESNSFDN
jgi:hypothetical protein